MKTIFSISKRILFTLTYPLWFFLAKTTTGGITMIALVTTAPGILIMLALHFALGTTSEDMRGTGVGLGIISLALSPIVGSLLMALGMYLEMHYEKWGYRTDEL